MFRWRISLHNCTFPGKGENIWDHMLHEHPEFSADGSNGDVAADSYHKYLEDVAIAKDLNVGLYLSFSV